MKSTKKAAIVTGIIAAILVPAITFAATATGAIGMSHTTPSFTKLPQSVQDMLKAKGVTVPTAEAMKAFVTKMKNERKGRKSLSEADQATLSAIMEKARIEERAFLRTKGIDLPSEDEIAQMKKFRESLKAIIESLPRSEAVKLKKEFNQNMGDEMGKDKKDKKDKKNKKDKGDRGSEDSEMNDDIETMIR